MSDNYSAASGQGIYAGRFAPSALTTLIDSMAPNTFAQLTTTNIREAVYNEYFDESYSALESDSARILTNWTNKYAYIQSKRRIVGIGTSEGYTGSAEGRFRSKCVSFNLATNAFTQAWNPTDRMEGHAYDANCSIPMNGKLYRKSFASPIVAQYDVDTELWTDAFSITGFGSLLQVYAHDVFPELGAQGSVMLLEQGGRLFRYDVATNVVSLVGTYGDIGTNQICIYVNGSVIFGAGNGGSVVGTLYKINSAGVVTALTASLPVQISVSGTINNKLLPDPMGRDIAFLFSNTDNMIRSLNTVTGAFTDIGAYDSNLADSSLVAGIPIHGTSGIAFWRGRGRLPAPTFENQSEFWVYRIPA